MGVGNDLLDHAKTVRRVLCPATNAFDKYEEILKTVQDVYEAGMLVLLALGPTATVLASDLADVGIQALDLGHMDIEYEWFRSGSKGVSAVEGKFTNEVAGGNQVAECADESYLSQIKARLV